MLDPSSSEEDSEELPGDAPAPALPGGGSPRPPPPAQGGPRPASPSPSVRSEGAKEEKEKIQREEETRRRLQLRLQLYVFVVRCIAHPFNAKQPTDMARRQQKGLKKYSIKLQHDLLGLLHPQPGLLYPPVV